MKTRLRLLTVGVVVTLLLSFVAVQTSFAQASPSDERLERISNNCLSIKNNLHQLQTSDALLRVNRGQIYETIATKLMDRFNSRLTNNGLDALGTIAVTSSYRKALESFRSDYISYERQLSAAIKIDCTKEPKEFSTAIEDARTKRAKVHADVVRLNQYVDDYRLAVNDFFINFERVTAE